MDGGRALDRTPSSLTLLAPRADGGSESTGAREHVVQFFDADGFLFESLWHFVCDGIRKGEAVAVVASESCRHSLSRQLTAQGVDVSALRDRGRYLELDTADTLSQIMVGEWPDQERFTAVIAAAIAPLTSGGEPAGVRVYGDMVGLLCMHGKHEAAVRLEEMWNAFAHQAPLSLLCGYPLQALRDEAHTDTFNRICALHSRVVPTESYTTLCDADARLRHITHLQQKASQLEHEINARKRAEEICDELRGAVEKAESEAEAVDSAKRDLLAMLGHELRNPLAAIYNAVVAAGRCHDSRREEAISIAHRQAKQLTRIVDDLIDVDWITRGKGVLRKERISLPVLLQRAIDGVRSIAEDRGQEFSVSLPDEPVILEVDPVRMEQALTNLLINAAKYSPPDSTINIRAARHNGHLMLGVRDYGIGITPSMLARVFDLFSQGDRSLDRVEGGLGIGLSLVKCIVELHGGSIEAHSNGLGTGADFVVQLPIYPPAPANGNGSLAHEETGRLRSRILIIEDNVDAAESLMMLIELLGHKVDVAHDGSTGINLARMNHPDIMLVDIGLPGIDGYEVARQARQDTKLQTARLIALTGYGSQEDKRRAMEAGFDEHLVKPLDPSTLEGLIARHTIR